MPVFPSVNLYFQGKSNTQLVVSEGRAPAEKWLPSSAVNAVTQFEYAFGPENNNEVVIPKGKILSAAAAEYDVVTEKTVPRVKICDADDAPLGVAQHNVYKYKRDRWSGNSVTILTRDYIRLPYFFHSTVDDTAKNAAAAIKWGAAWYESAATNKNDIVGKLVVSDANGNFEIKDSITTVADLQRVVGQVLGVETDIPPAGYLQFFMGMVESDYTDFIESTQNVPSAGRTVGSTFGDIGSYPYSAANRGVGYQSDKYTNAKAAFSDIIKGIPYLTDGYFKARGEYVYTTTAYDQTQDTYAYDATWVQGNVTESSGKFTCNNTDSNAYIGSAIFVKIPDELAHDTLEPGETVANYPELNSLANSLAVYFTNDAESFTASAANMANVLDPSDNSVEHGSSVETTATAVSADNIYVDYNNNIVVVYLTAEIADDGDAVENELVVQAVTIKDNVAGIPTLWDFKGTVGEVRVLLRH